MSQSLKRTLIDITSLSMLLSILFGFMLGSRPFQPPDEGRYVEIPREMAVTNDYVTPRLNGVKYFEKPPLFYWMQSFMVKAFGINEWSMRILPALFGVLGCLFVYWAGLQLWGRLEGLLSAVILSTSILYFALSHIIILDMAVSVFMTIALFSFLLAQRAPPGRGRTIYLFMFSAACAGSTLTKGLIGIAIPGAIILLWSLFSRKWDALKLAFKPWGILLFIVLAAPWHILASIRNPNFAFFYFVHEHFLRYLTDVHSRTQPFYFFVPIVLVGLFPWGFFLFQSLRNIWKSRKEKSFADELFLLVWIGFTFLFFSAGRSKLIPYILPIFPPIALLIGKYIAPIWKARETTNSFRRGTIAYGLFCLILAVLPWVGIFDKVARNYEAVKYSQGILISLSMTVAAVAVFLLRSKPRQQIIAMIATSCVFYVALLSAWPVLTVSRLIRPIAYKIQEIKKPGDEIVSYHEYYQDLPPYINSTVKMVGNAGELEHGKQWEDTSGWMIDEQTFGDLWKSSKTMLVVTEKRYLDDFMDRYGKKLYKIQEAGDSILISNKDLSGNDER